MKSGFRQVVGTWIVLATIAGPAFGQVTSGTVSGTVKDAQSGVIPGATVTLLNDTQGTKSTPVVTSATGDFVFATVRSGVYTLQVEMPSFKTLKRSGIVVSAGERVTVGTLTLDVGGSSEVVDVRAETPLIQASTGERSFAVATDAVANLPLASRNFSALANLAPGVDGTNPIRATRIGGGGETNFMMDGVSVMDTGSNRLLMAVNVESIAEVKVLTSGYQAEYGRSSGLQITAVTKSGTNRFHGSVYDVERNGNWGPNSKTNKLNGVGRTTTESRDWGFSLGGPAGKPGGANKLFFFYAQEFNPRTSGNNVQRYRLPTELERAGDFSQSLDNNSALYPFIKDPNTAGVCTAANTAGCFRDGGVLGRIPANRLYPIGLNVLKMFPLPNCQTVGCDPGVTYNFQITRPNETLLGWQPAVRVDYTPVQSIRVGFKYASFGQPSKTVNGPLPGFNDTKMQRPSVLTWGTNFNYTINQTTFLEATYGFSRNEQAGCALTGGSPNFCQNALATNEGANRNNVGLGGLPFLFPDATVIDQRVLRAQGPRDGEPTDVGRHPGLEAPHLRVGQPGRQRAAQYPVSWVPQRQPQSGCLGQPGQGRRPAHAEERVLQHL